MKLYLQIEARAMAWLARAAGPGLAGTIGILAAYTLVAWLEQGAVA